MNNNLTIYAHVDEKLMCYRCCIYFASEFEYREHHLLQHNRSRTKMEIVKNAELTYLASYIL